MKWEWKLTTFLLVAVSLGPGQLGGDASPTTDHLHLHSYHLNEISDHPRKSISSSTPTKLTSKDSTPPTSKFTFTQSFYNASVPENSLGSTMVIPQKEKMGLWNPSSLDIHFSIEGGDPHQMFRVESRQVGDFNFLILRVRNNDRILNREFKEVYKIQVKASVYAEEADEPSNSSSVFVASPLVSPGVSQDSTITIPPVNNNKDPLSLNELEFSPSFIVGEQRSKKESIINIASPSSPSSDSHLDPFSRRIERETDTDKTDNVTSGNKTGGGKGKRGKGKGKDRKSRRNPSSLEDSSSSSALSLRRSLRDELRRSSNGGGGESGVGSITSNLNRTRGGRTRGGRRNRVNKERHGESGSGGGLSGSRGSSLSSTLISTSTSTASPTTLLPSTSSTVKPKPTKSKSRILLMEAETIVFVRIIDVDDNQPVFESPSYDIGVNEDSPVLSKVAKINAADADVGRNSEIYYSLADWNEFWSIDPITGVLSPTRPLVGRSKDRDRDVIKVRARNRWNASPTSGSTANVNIHIRPVNRYPPQIRVNKPPQVEIRPYGVIYAVVSIRDPDEGENGMVDLEIKEGDPNGVFRVNPTSSRNEFYIEMSPIVAESFHKTADKFFVFNLTLRASDRGTPIKTSEKELQVRVADAVWSDKNSQSHSGAIFDKDVYEVEISETSPPHSVVFRLKRPDSKVGLSISSGNEGEDFRLEEKSGVLYTNKWLDAESKSTYTLTIDSHDRRPSNRIGDFYRRRQSVAKIIVKVIDGNDNSPEFETVANNKSLEFSVLENEGVGTRVARMVAKDRDSGENGYITYSIANLKPTPFTIDHFTGEIRSSKLLDYEIDRRDFILKIRASDWGQPSRRQSQKTIQIHLKDINDNRPLFTVKDCIVVIDRTSIKYETELGRLEAIDFDRDDLVSYRIVGGNEDGCFGLDPNTGRLRVQCDLRGELGRVANKRVLNVTATDGEYYSDVMVVRVELWDGRINSFNNKSGDVGGGSVKSGMKIFSTIHSIFECQDTGVQERFHRMAALSEKNNQFDEMDLNEINGFPPLPSRYGENVHTPQFIDFPKEIRVFENATVGTEVLKFLAKDLDKGYNGLLTFVISGGDEAHGAWDIVNSGAIIMGGGSPDEAALVVAAPLDREEIPSYVLNISVWDQGKPPKSTFKLLPIKVLDSNDCPPVFTKSALKIKIGEGSELVGEEILQVTAFDEDEPGSPNSLISYRFLNSYPEFTIDQKSGTIRLNGDLDRERQDHYELLVSAEDGGSPRLSSIAVVSIQVEDKNDCPPKFESFGGGTSSSASRVVKVTEDWPVGGVVTQVVARDQDLGLAGKIRYSLVETGAGEEDFLLDEISGVLRIKKRLDYETMSIYNLTVRAKDLGSPSLSSETFIVVEVFDVIETNPTLSFNDIVTQASISEDAPVGSPVTQVTLITPPDVGGTFSSSVSLALEGDSSSRFLFTIDSSGLIRTAYALDYETKSSHWLTISARSTLTGKSLAKMELYISILDINECYPLTELPSYRVSLSESAKASSPVLTLSAFDCDPGQGLRFSMKTSTPYFEIHPITGQILTTEVSLDREKTPIHIFEISVSDMHTPQLNSSTQIIVELLDENDNSPKFLHKRGIHNIPEILAELQGDQPKELSPDNLSSENEEEEMEEEVEEDEEDEDAHKWSDWNAVILEEERDNEMYSEGGGWKKIFQVVAWDGDEGLNGTVKYRLKYRVSTGDAGGTGTNQGPSLASNGAATLDEVYTINSMSGEIFTSASGLKPETMLKFIIEASDGGSPEPRRTETMLMLRVRPVPKKISSPPEILLPEGTSVSLTTKERAGYTVETIDALDPDNDELWYEIVSGDPQGHFIMWPESQNLILARPVPHAKEFRLNISVSDGSNPVFVQLIVKVIESERISSLIWEQSNYSAVIPEDQTDFVQVVTLRINSTASSAHSSEDNSKGTILYGFHNSQDSRSLSIFTIDTLSGEVSVRQSSLIDKESLPTHILTVKARDPFNFYSFTRLTIVLEEFNDHPPIFYSPDGRYPRTEVRIPETTAVGALIAQIEAFDMDEGEAGRLDYSITFGNIGNTFGIDRTSGWLHLGRPLSLPFGETSVEYQLTVQAQDNGVPPLSSTTNVNVLVTLASDDDLLSLRCSGEDDRDPPYWKESRKYGNTPAKSKGKTVMRVRVKENSQAGSYVTTIRAVNSGSVSFEIEDNRNNVFWIDPATGVVLVGKGKGLLDREVKPTHEILVRATNSRGASATCRVVVDLLDENDHRPLFTTVYYEGLIREDSPPGTLVRKKPSAASTSGGDDEGTTNNKKPLVLESTDSDVGLNALVTYSIIEEEEMRKVFHIDPSTGALLLVTSLDFEKRHSYVFHVKATDGGGLISPNVATVNVSVENVNMKKPLVSSARVELLLPTSLGVLVYRVTAKDPDGDELEFNLTRGNDSEFFKIGKKSGEIRVGRVEGLRGAKHVLEVSVSDGRFWSVATITIHTKQIERNADFYFRNSTFFTAALENSTKVINLLGLSVVGAFMNEPLRFELLSPSPYFGIKTTSGVIFTTGKKLDREQTPSHTLLLEVRGEEASRVARCLVKVLVTDKNDECPQFLNLPYVAVVSLEGKAGDSVIQVKAFDGDEGENAVIRYELVRSPYGDVYELDRHSGVIRMRRRPDAVGQHEITIKAYDGGVPTCTTETTVLVKIISSDQPVFEQQWYETWIPEDAALQSTALALVAHAKNPILYSIDAGNDFDEFGIDYQTGVLYVNSPLDFETQTTHRLTIRATDLVTSSGSSTHVLIHIRDSNDARPVFEKPVYHIRLTEGYMPSHGLLASVKAHDNDTGINALLTYELIADDAPILRLSSESLRSRREISVEDVDVEMVAEDATSNQRAGDVSRFFMVKPNDGSIVLKQMVDYERAHEFRFSVVVKDSGIPPLSSTARVVVEVVDVNDSGVVFEKSLYTARVSELASRGHFIGKVSAYDPDSVDSLRYSIVGHNHYQSAFEIDEKSGIVSLSQPSVLLTELAFELNISVTDGVFTSYSRLHIEVEPRNHHAPSFSSLIYEVGCPENAPDGHLIAKLHAVDPDRSIYGQVKYSIAQTDEPELFGIDGETGEVRLKVSSDVYLDREVRGSHTLEIVAEDGGGWLGYTKLAVKVIDVNEYPPQFPVSEYRVTVPADRIKSKTPILQVVAVDADTEFGIRYSVVDLPTSVPNLRSISNNSTSTTIRSTTSASNGGTKRDSSYFEINGESGELRLRMSDQDVIKFMKDKSRVDFQFWAGATDEGGLHSYIPVTVVLLPEGVASPEMTPYNATFFVKEDAPIGSIVTTFRVSNIPSPKFRVVSSNDEFFQVDHNGNLLVKARLDQENEDKHTVVIWAESADGMSVATSQVTVRVFQSMGRKHPPVFQSREYKVKVAEDFPEGSLIFTVRALDSDKSNNIKEKYSLSPSNSQDLNHFSVNQEHGWITLVNKLDYETKTEHILHVVAADADKPYLMSTATVTVEVLNVPDCPVSFDTSHYFSSVREDVPDGTVIATVHATDLDSLHPTRHHEGFPSAPPTSSPPIVFNYLAYFILEGNDKGHFKINERGELSIWRGLDYEEDQKFLLRIVATDGFYTDYANVTVTIMDVNDNSPVCPIPEYEVRLSESVPVGTYVVTVEAHDPDLSALAPTFSVVGHGSTDFSMEPETGVVSVAKSLDRETIPLYTLVGYAEDRESGEACQVEIRVKVLDENDNEPRFTEEEYLVTVKEDAPVGALIGKVHADDRDAGLNRRLRYSLVSVRGGGYSSSKPGTLIDDQFSIESSSGVISLLRALDRELVPSYNLSIQATDSGLPSLSSTVRMRVMVLDVNDNPPEFAFTYYSATISELAPVSSEVTRVLATSKDIGVNAEITYDIVGGNGYNHFGIHPKTGIIFVSSPLDYERIREYVLAIRARDGGSPPLASQALVNISLIDQNDNAPQFSSGSSSYSVQIPEDAAIGTSVIQIQAADLDSGDNSKIKYQIGSGDRLRHFRIDPSNGIVTVSSVLDREMIPHYSLEVWAVDHGLPVLSSSTTVEIDILDYNDSPPLIRVPDDEIIVQEDRPVGYTIHKFDVSDADAPPNSEPFSWDLRDLEKSKASSPGILPFTISESGLLNVAGKLNSQRKNLYHLQVRVFDNGDPPLFSDANVTVKVVDKSQWPPVVSTLTVTAITAAENYPAGVPLGKVHASDFDPYDILVYALVETPSSAHFTIDYSNGTLKSLTPLPAGTYELGVTVSDGRWTARGDAYIRILTLASLVPDMKLDDSNFPSSPTEKGKSHGLHKSRKDIGIFAVVITLKGHTPQSFLSKIFAFINEVREAMDPSTQTKGGPLYDVVILSVQSAKEPHHNSSKRSKRSTHLDEPMQMSSPSIPSVDILLSVRKASDSVFVPPVELLKKLRFALPQIESVLSAKVTRLTFDICKEDSCERGQCRTVATFEGTQSLITTETLSLITPNHYLETVCSCPPGFGGGRCEKVINACAHSECMSGFICVPDASPKGYACLCRKSYCPPGIPCDEEDHCAQQSVSFSGTSFLAYNVGPALERELSISLKIKTLYTSGTLLHSFGHFDYAILEIRQGLVQFSWDLGTGKEVLTVTSISVSDNRWHRVLLHLRDNTALLRVDERSTQRQRSPGPARSLHTGGIVYIGAKVIGRHGSVLESYIPAQGFIGCMKDLRCGYPNSEISKGMAGGGSDLTIQEVKHYITPGINRVDTDFEGGIIDDEEIEEAFERQENEGGKGDNNKGGLRMAQLPLHSSDSDRLGGSHLIWSRNISFSCDRILHVVESCRSQPCLNGGSCSEDRQQSGAPSGYHCDCPSRFHGLNCEVDRDPCGSTPCLNGGSCVPNSPGIGISFSPSLVSGGEWVEPQFFCQCPFGTSGLRCERGRWCRNSESLLSGGGSLGGEYGGGGGMELEGSEICRHGGECEEGPSGPICWCAGGYTGATCQLDINECERGDACGPASTCINFQGGFRCLCPSNATGLRCNRILVTPSIVVSDYQDLIIIVVSVAFLCISLLIILVIHRRCCKRRRRNAGGASAIPLTSSHLKDSKDNRLPPNNSREQEQLLRNRDSNISKISNFEARPVSATSDIFISAGGPGDDLEKPTYINNLMKESVPMKDKATTASSGQPAWHSNLDDYSKVQNYMKGDLNWVVPKPTTKPGSPTSNGSFGYHWDTSDLSTQPNISPTLPPPDLPDSTGGGSSGSPHSSNNCDVLPTINLAALPPIGEPVGDRQGLHHNMGPLTEETEEEDDDDNPHEPLPYFDTEGTSVDGPNSWSIPHPDQYLPLHSLDDGGGGLSDHQHHQLQHQQQMCSCPHLDSPQQQQLTPSSKNNKDASSSSNKPLALRNRYRHPNSSNSGKKGVGTSSSSSGVSSAGSQHKVSDVSDDEINESASLLGGSSRAASATASLPVVVAPLGSTGGSLSSLGSSKSSSKIPRLHQQQPQQPSSSSVSSLNSSGGGGGGGSTSSLGGSKKNHSKTTHVTQV